MSHCTIIKKSEAFDLLEEAECTAIDEIAEEREVKAGTIIGKEDEDADEFYLVLEGELSVSINAALHEPMEVVIATLGPGEITGWSSLHRGGKLTTTIKATRDSKILVWNAERLHQFLLRNCGMGYRILQEVIGVVAKRLVNSRMALTSCVMDNK